MQCITDFYLGFQYHKCQGSRIKIYLGPLEKLSKHPRYITQSLYLVKLRNKSVEEKIPALLY
jgi:hypothetical protein